MTLHQRSKSVLYGYTGIIIAFLISSKAIPPNGVAVASVLWTVIPVLVLIFSLFLFVKSFGQPGNNMGTIFGITGIIISAGLLLLILSTSFILTSLFKILLPGSSNAAWKW